MVALRLGSLTRKQPGRSLEAVVNGVAVELQLAPADTDDLVAPLADKHQQPQIAALKWAELISRLPDAPHLVIAPHPRARLLVVEGGVNLGHDVEQYAVLPPEPFEKRAQHLIGAIGGVGLSLHHRLVV